MKIYEIKICDYNSDTDEHYFVNHSPVVFCWIVFEDHTSVAIYDELHTFGTSETDSYRFMQSLLRSQVDKVINQNILRFKRSFTPKTFINTMVDATTIKIITANDELDIIFCCCHDGDCKKTIIGYQRLPVEYYNKIVLNKLSN